MLTLSPLLLFAPESTQPRAGHTVFTLSLPAVHQKSLWFQSLPRPPPLQPAVPAWQCGEEGLPWTAGAGQWGHPSWPLPSAAEVLARRSLQSPEAAGRPASASAWRAAAATA